MILKLLILCHFDYDDYYCTMEGFDFFFFFFLYLREKPSVNEINFDDIYEK